MDGCIVFCAIIIISTAVGGITSSTEPSEALVDNRMSLFSKTLAIITNYNQTDKSV